jgi:hypothetical protein
MAVTINAKGTSVSSFAIGKNGTLITQTGSISAPASNDLDLSAPTGQSIIHTIGAETLEFSETSLDSSVDINAPNLTGTNTGDQTITLTGDVTGSGTGSFAATLATVNSNIGTFASVTVNGKGLVTAASALSGDITTSGATATLATVNSNVGQFTAVTVNAKGLVTAATDLAATGDATGTASGAGIALTLATVNGSPQSDTFRKITVNGKGLTTATSAVLSSDITTALGFTPVDKAGDTMLGNLILNADPSAALGAATKQYVDNAASGLNVHGACVTATTAALPTSTYNNGAGGVGATLTANANGAIGTVGGYASLVVADRVLVKNQASTLQNGIYVVTQLGDGSNPWILTRASDFDGSPTSEITAGDSTFVQDGTLAGTQWVQTTSGTITVGTSAIVFTQFGGPGTYVGGTGIDVTGTTISLATGNTLSLYNLATNGIVARTASNTVTARTIIGTAGNILVTDGDGVAGNPTLDLATVTDTGSGTFLKLTRDSFGRVSGTTAVVASDITSLVDGTYVNIAGDTMTGPLGINGAVSGYEFEVAGASTNGPIARLWGAAVQTRGLQISSNAINGLNGSLFDFYAPGSTGSNGAISFTGQYVFVNQIDEYTTTGFTANAFQIANTTGAAGLTISSWAGATSTSPDIQSLKSRGATVGTNAIVASGDNLLQIVGSGDDGTAFIPAAQISFNVDGTPGTNDMPGRIVFSTTADGASTVTERMRIDSDGNVTISQPAAGIALTVNGLSGTGVAAFRQAAATSAYISIAGNNSTPGTSSFDLQQDSASAVDIVQRANARMSLYTNGSERMRLAATGNITINAPTSGTPLAIAGGGIDFSSVSTLNQTVAGDFTINASNASGEIAFRVAGAERARISNTGAATFTSSVTAVSFNATSTKRVKKAIKNLSNSVLSKFDQLKPREYDRKDYVAHEFGFIAEEMALIYPEVVSIDQSGKPAAIDYGKLSTILTAKVQEQQVTINKLQEQMKMVLDALKGKK